MSDQTDDGRTLKYLTVVDEFTRASRRVYCARSITSGSVIEQLELRTNYVRCAELYSIRVAVP